MSRRWPALLALTLLAAGCGREDRTPEGAVKRFLQATYEGDSAEVYRLLAPASQRELQGKARLANAQAAGRKVQPQDLLAVGRETPRYEATQVRTLSVEGDAARVEISNPRRSVRQVLELVRVGDLWRLLMPPPLQAPPKPPASMPATQPASAPASLPSTQPASQPASRPALPR